MINNQVADVSISSRFCMKQEGNIAKSGVILLASAPCPFCRVTSFS